MIIPLFILPIRFNRAGLKDTGDMVAEAPNAEASIGAWGNVLLVVKSTECHFQKILFFCNGMTAVSILLVKSPAVQTADDSPSPTEPPVDRVLCLILEQSRGFFSYGFCDLFVFFRFGILLFRITTYDFHF